VIPTNLAGEYSLEHWVCRHRCARMVCFSPASTAAWPWARPNAAVTSAPAAIQADRIVLAPPPAWTPISRFRPLPRPLKREGQGPGRLKKLWQIRHSSLLLFVLFAGHSVSKAPRSARSNWSKPSAASITPAPCLVLVGRSVPLSLKLRQPRRRPTCRWVGIPRRFRKQSAKLPRVYALADLVRLPSVGAAEPWAAVHQRA